MTARQMYVCVVWLGARLRLEVIQAANPRLNGAERHYVPTVDSSFCYRVEG
jgi:hypothetical protein